MAKLGRYRRWVTETGEQVPESLAGRLPGGRLFKGIRKVRLGDVGPSGNLRLDALTRYTQDVSNDDTTDAKLDDNMAWVVRRTTIDLIRPAVFGENLEFTTFCSGLGRRWAERRLEVVGEAGGHYEVATLWIYLDEATGLPKQLTPQFLEIYAEAAGDRAVTARLSHDSLPETVDANEPWPLRTVDFDLFNHMNNAAYWAAMEELGLDGSDIGRRLVVEYRNGIGDGSRVELAVRRRGQQAEVWWISDRGTAQEAIAATATSTPLADNPYEVGPDGGTKTVDR
jgi:acyl-ACP thioesterase